MITGIAHVNLTVPTGTLAEAEEFYGATLGFESVPVPESMTGRLKWFDITPKGQQIHIAFGPPNEDSSRHPCFKVESPEALLNLQQRIYTHFEKGGPGAPKTADKPGESSGTKAPEFPVRFFARDYANNRLEFTT